MRRSTTVHHIATFQKKLWSSRQFVNHSCSRGFFSQCRTTDAPRTQWCLEPVEELSDLQFTAEIDDLLTPTAQDHCKWNLFLISFLFASVCYLFIGLSYICYTSRANVEVSTLNLSLDFVWGWRPRQDVLWKLRWIALYKSTKSIGVICQMSNVTRYHILQNMSTGSASIWSGRNLGRVYAKEPSGRQCHGESWEPCEGASCIWLLFRSLHHDIPRHEGMEWAWNESLWQQLSARNSGSNCSNVPDAVHLHVHLRVRYGKSAGRFGVEAFHWIL